jgi:hypothetical protein
MFCGLHFTMPSKLCVQFPVKKFSCEGTSELRDRWYARRLAEVKSPVKTQKMPLRRRVKTLDGSAERFFLLINASRSGVWSDYTTSPHVYVVSYHLKLIAEI